MDNEPTLRFRWNDHVPHLSKVFSEQRIDEHYCNTSLVTDDGYIIKVHGIILTMTSGYFERILRNVSQDQHPIIVLNGVNYKELICVIDYIYQGLTRVDERLMASVLDLADVLEIKGLSKMKNNMSVKKLIAPSNPLSILPQFHCSPKIISSISSLSQNSDNNHTLKIDSEEASSLEKERRDYEVTLDRSSVVCVKGFKERCHQVSDNVSLSEQAEESMDQTLGIDLSLSKSGSSVIINKDTGKSFNFYEDGTLRKRKCNLENSENFRIISNDVDFGKIGDKVEIDVLYKQKKLFGKSPGDEERNTFCRQSINRRKLIGKAKPDGLTSPAANVEKKNVEYFSFSESEDEFPEIKCNQSTFDEGSTGDFSKRSWSPAEDDMFNVANTLPYKGDSLHRKTETFINKGFKNFHSLDFLHDKHINFINFHPSPIIRPVFYETKCDNQGNINLFSSCPESVHVTNNDSCSVPQVNILSNELPTINLPEMIKVHLNSMTQGQGPTSSDNVKEIFDVMDCRKPKSQVKKPLNMYNLYVKSMLPSISSQYTNRQKISLISQMWNSLSSDEKHIWAEKAKDMKTKFFKRNPGFEFQSETSRIQKEEYKRKKLAKKYLFLRNNSR